MTDYIKREDAINVFCWNEDLYVRCGIATQNIKDIPSADVVEVVRCKDCKYYKEDVWAEVNNVPLIVAHEMCEFWGDGCKTEENSYCSYGERAEA